MMSGVIGMDIVLLVIAADEGIMPQTKEHLDILKLLEINKGIIVLTKADTVDNEWLELVKEDVCEYMKGTFLENSPIIPVSSIKGTNIDKLIENIEDLTEEIEERDIKDTPRLPIDRVFTITGFGTIVTGTLISGEFKIGDEVEIYPTGKRSRIRSLQVHGIDSNNALAGQRVAINLAGIKKTELERGNIVAPVDAMSESMMLDVKLNLLDNSPRIIENRSRVRLFVGTNEVLCRVVLLDKENLTPGESAYAQLRLEEKLVVKRGDKFIIRFYSPVTTIGGGLILDPNPPKRKRFNDDIINDLKLKEKNDDLLVLENIIKEKSEIIPGLSYLSKATVIPEEKIIQHAKKLDSDNKIVILNIFNSTHFIHKHYYDNLKKYIIDELTKFHSKFPLKSGMIKEEFRSKYFGKVKPKLGETLINMLIEDKIVKQLIDKIALKNFEVNYNGEHNKIKLYLEKKYISNKLNPIKTDEIINESKFRKEEVLNVLESLIDNNVIIKLNEQILIHNSIYTESLIKIKKYIEENEYITVSILRDLVSTNRKYAMALLEYLDVKKITKRIDDKRILL